MRFWLSPKTIGSLLLACLLAGPVLAQLPLPTYSKLPLLNGMEILVLEAPEPSSGNADFILMIRNGAAFDPVEKYGATYLLTQLLIGGSERRTGEQLQADLTTLGARVDVLVEPDAVYFRGSAPPDRLSDTLNVLGEIVVRPGLDEAVFERLKLQQLNDLAAEAADPRTRNLTVFRAELFGHNPYGHSVKGNSETVANLTLVDIKIQYRRLFLPNQAQLALYYSGDSAQLLRIMGRAWGGWIRDDGLPFTFRQADPPAGRRIILIDSGSDEEALLHFGTLGARLGTADFFTLKVLEHYITLSLSEWAREVTDSDQIKARVDHVAGRMPGQFALRILSRPAHVVEYLRRLDQFFTNLRAGQVSAERLTEARELALLEVRTELEQPEGRLKVLLKALLNDQGISFFAAYGPRLERVDSNKIRDASNRYFPANSFLALVTGDGERLKAELEKVGAVEILN